MLLPNLSSENSNSVRPMGPVVSLASGFMEAFGTMCGISGSPV